MQTVNIHESKTHLSRLVDLASKGEAFIVAKSGKSFVTFTAPETAPIKRLGFMAGTILVPDDFDKMGQVEIEQIFGGVL